MSEVVFKLSYGIIPYLLVFLFIVTIIGILKMCFVNAKNKVNEIIAEKTSEKCPNCGGYLIQKKGRYGKFYGCTNYPYCEYTRKI